MTRIKTQPFCSSTADNKSTILYTNHMEDVLWIDTPKRKQLYLLDRSYEVKVLCFLWLTKFDVGTKHTFINMIG